MRKSFLKIVSVLLTMVMLFSAVPINVFAEDETEVESTNNNMTVSATNSVGEMLTEELDNVELDLDAPYYISDLVFEEQTATVEFYNEAECKVVVAVYDEDTMQMLSSQMADVEAEALTASLEFEDSLPEYFVAKAFLLGDSNEGLCKAYTSNHNTEEFQDFISKTTEDFPENIVINLDESVDNNFLVMNDNGQSIQGDEETNVLASQDLATNTYVFENIDDSIKNLKSGDVFYLDNGDEENVVVIKVSSIEIDGTTATIVAEEAELEEVFEHVKIDSACYAGDFEFDDTQLDEDVEYLGDVDYDSSVYSSRAIDYDASANVSKKYVINEKSVKNSDDTATAKISGSVTLKAEIKFKVYISKSFKEVSLVLTPSIKVSISATGKISMINIKLGELKVSPVAGLYIGITPTFVVSVSGSLTISGELKFAIGAGWNSDTGVSNKCSSPTFKPTVTAEVTFFVGFDMKPNVTVLSEKVAKAELSATVGAEIKAKNSSTAGASSGSTKHDCKICIDGSIDGKLKVGLTLTFTNKVAFSRDFVNLTVDIADFYYSITYGDFDFTSCPHITYRVVFNVKDLSGNAISGASVLGETTDSSGKATVYLSNGAHGYTVTASGYSSCSGSVLVQNNARTISISLGTIEQGGSSGSDEDLSGSGGSSGGITDDSFKNIDIGDSIILGNYNGVPIEWVCVDIDENGPLMLSKEILCSKEYDAPGTSAAYHNDGWGGRIRTNYGSSCWQDSNIRQWLNSNESEVSWTHCSPSYANEAGFLTNFTTDELQYIKPVNRIVNVITYESKRSGYCDGGSGDNVVRTIYNTSFSATSYCYKYIEDSMFLISALQYNRIYNNDPDFLRKEERYFMAITSGNNANCFEWVATNIPNSHEIETSTWASHTWGIRPAFYLNNTEEIVMELSNVESGSNGSVENSITTLFDAKADSCVAGNDYILLNISDYSENFELTTDNLFFIDQITADKNGKVNANFIPKTAIENSTTLLIGDFGNGTEIKEVVSNNLGEATTSLRLLNATEYRNGNNITILANSDVDRVAIYSTTFAGETVTVETADTPVTVSSSKAFVLKYNDWHKAGNAMSTTLTIGEEEYNVKYIFRINGDGHEYSAVVTEPTSTSQGFTTYTCFCGDSYVTDYVDALGNNVSGAIKTFGDAENDVTLEFIKSGDTEITYSFTLAGDEKEYSFDGISAGDYILKVSKQNHVTCEYEVKVNGEDITLDVQLNLIGDIDGNGKVNITDYNAILRHVKKTSALDGYAFDCADIDGNGRIMVTDYNAVLRHVKKTELLW